MIDDSMRLPIWDDTDWTYIKGLSQSIDSISLKYIYDSDNKKYHIERIFSYELYHKWSNYLRKKNVNPEKLMLNAELSKHYDDKDNNFPDMVLHGDYTDYSKQFIICEIKSSRNYVNNEALCKDMKSLSSGIIKLGYHCGVFIYLGGEKSQIRTRLRKILNELKIKNLGILLVIVDKSGVINYNILK